MKTPRVKDFDPDAKVPNLKSTLENMPSIQKSTTLNTTPLAKKVDRIENTENSTRITMNKEEIPPVLPVLPVRDVRGDRDVPPVPLKRMMKSRWPIDIYQDQYDSLKNIALEE